MLGSLDLPVDLGQAFLAAHSQQGVSETNQNGNRGNVGSDSSLQPPQGLVTDRVTRNVEEARQALRFIFESKTTEQVAHTGYGLVQAAGEYLDHVRNARSWETRLNRTLIRPEPLKHRALSLIREVVTAA